MKVNSSGERRLIVDQEFDIIPLLQSQRRRWELAVSQDHLSRNPSRQILVLC
jgi:hypothetical protein